MKKSYGYKPDKHDPRDLNHKISLTHRLLRGTTLPQKVDLRPFCSYIEDQSSLGSCSANSAVGALEILENKSHAQFIDFSRLFVYYYTRFLENTVNEDAGAELRDVIKALQKFGACDEKIWPYNIDKFKEKPSVEALKDANKHQISKYARIKLGDLVCMQGTLADGYPIIFGAMIYESLQNVGKDGMVPMPTRQDKEDGGHAMLVVGYDKAKRVFIVRNSWGIDYGDMGYVYFPMEYFELKYGLIFDMWTIMK